MTQSMTTEKTDAIRGVAILGILCFHILIELGASPLFNFWGGVLTAVFLILSGYGLSESCSRRGLEGYWQRRWEKVFLPCILWVCLYNLLATDGSMRRCAEALANRGQPYWFIFHLLKCYLIFWAAARFGGRQGMRLMAAGAVGAFAFSQLWYHNNLESGQTLSFVLGVWLSRHKGRWQAVSRGRAARWTCGLLLAGAAAYAVKATPAVHALKYTLAYSPFILALNLSWGTATLLLLLRARPERLGVLGATGRMSLYVYMVHMSMLSLLQDLSCLPAFLFWVAAGLLGCWLYRRYAAGRILPAEMLFTCLNALFVAKYSARMLPQAYPCITLAFILAMTVLQSRIARMQGGSRAGGRWLMLIPTGALLGMLAVQCALNPLDLQVDRWSALAYPIRNLLAGVYPYSAHTHLGGFASPFPVWQVLHIPFYLMGNVGLSLFAVLLLYVGVLRRCAPAPVALHAALLLSCSVAVWYEAAVRSDLMTNMLLTAALTAWLQPRLTPAWARRHWPGVAVAVGLMASTRLLALVPLAMLLLPCLPWLGWRRSLCSLGVAAATAAATFLPFALWDWQSLMHFPYAPWVLQTRQGQPSDLLLLVPCMLALTFVRRSRPSTYFRAAALMLTLTAAASQVHRMFLSGNWDLFHPAYDITYLSAALPFCIAAIALRRQEMAESGDAPGQRPGEKTG